ncbi:hypothetical protein ACQ27_gp216 [Klebsiella phage K64-1]|nr:hypothetical protein ACQ27_gp216 [Klebsiella phage K64-1]
MNQKFFSTNFFVINVFHHKHNNKCR